MPKVDPHLHLGGVTPPSFVWDTIQRYDLKHLAESAEDVRCQMTFCDGEARTFHRFLDKFRILDELPWTPELIDSSVEAVCDYLKGQRVDYAWMDFSINKYMKIGWHKREAIQFIRDSFERHYPGRIGLILSLKYESMRASQRQYAKLIEDPVAAACLVGLDLVGDEEYFDADFYEPIFRDWNAAGKVTRCHVGESKAKENVLDAMQRLRVTNVAHGFKVMEDPEMVSWARDAGVTFDLALTSNDVTGVWPLSRRHPLHNMLGAGLRCTLGSDDPVQCGTTLDREFEIATQAGVSLTDLGWMREVAWENFSRSLGGLR